MDTRHTTPATDEASVTLYANLPLPVTVHTLLPDDTLASSPSYANAAARHLPATLLAGNPTCDDETSRVAPLLRVQVAPWPLAAGERRTLLSVKEETTRWFYATVQTLTPTTAAVFWEECTDAATAVSAIAYAYEDAAHVRSLLECTLDGMPDGFVIAQRGNYDDHDGQLLIEHVNPMAEVALSESDLIGLDINPLLAGVSASLQQRVNAAVETRIPDTIRVDTRDEQGDVLHAQDISVFPAHEDHVVLLFRDATQKAVAEQRLEQAWAETCRARIVLQGAVDAIESRFVVLAVDLNTPDAIPSVVMGNSAAAYHAGSDSFDEFIGDTPTRVWGQDLAAELVQRAEICVAVEAPQIYLESIEEEGGALQSLIEHKLHPIGDSLVVVTSRDVTEEARREHDMRKQTEQARYAATHDSLTGLANRVLLLEQIDQALRTPEERFVILFADLDKFKPVNDTYGHAVGDDLLVEIGRRLQTLVREKDTVARLGGDEFVLLLRGISDTWDEATFTDRAVASISAPFAATLEGNATTDVAVGASFGSFRAIGHTTTLTAKDVLDEADKAMYARKAKRKR